MGSSGPTDNSARWKNYEIEDAFRAIGLEPPPEVQWGSTTLRSQLGDELEELIAAGMNPRLALQDVLQRYSLPPLPTEPPPVEPPNNGYFTPETLPADPTTIGDYPPPVPPEFRPAPDDLDLSKYPYLDPNYKIPEFDASKYPYLNSGDPGGSPNNGYFTPESLPADPTTIGDYPPSAPETLSGSSSTGGGSQNPDPGNDRQGGEFGGDSNGDSGPSADGDAGLGGGAPVT